MDAPVESPPKTRRFLRKLIAPILAGLAIVLLVLIGPAWMESVWEGLRDATRRAIAIGFLQTALFAYGATLLLATAGGAVALIRVIRGRRMRQPRPFSARILLLSLASLFGLMLLELGAWQFHERQHRIPAVPSDTSPETRPKTPQTLTRDDTSEIVLLVLGESSAEGQPYQPWLSIGHIVAWQIERALPGRRVRVIMGATGGIPLSYTIAVMEEQTERPDIVLLYSGHNEFQARWGWTRVVRYYQDDSIQWTRDGLVDRVGDWTPFCALIRECVDTQRIDMQPSLKERRELVERPVCEPETRAHLRELFETELDVVARWSERAGALPIFVIPAGNDVDFDPGRSILSPQTPLAGRKAFARAFDAAKAKQESHDNDAIPAFRALIARQPSFAEAHYRLAQMLRELGKKDEARAEYVLARDLDGMPMRCPSEFQNAYRAVGARHDMLLIDGPARLQALSPTGFLDDNVFHDAQHPSFRGYLALAQNVMDGLWQRGAFGLPKGPAPRVDPDECASHFGMTNARWAEVCRRAARFWGGLAKVRYVAGARRIRADRFREAGIAIDKGASLESLHVPGLGARPAGFP